MRVFIALQAGDLFAFGPGAPASDPEDPLSRLSVEEVEKSLRGAGGKLRFVKPEARHLTLKFLGDVEAGAAAGVTQALDKAVGATPAFPVGARGVGFFPNARRPKVIWAGVDDPEKQIQPLHLAIEKEVAALGFERGAEGFIPHITIARVIEVSSGEALARAVDPLVDTRFGWTRATGVDFWQSTLTPNGPIYRLISGHTFKGG